MKRAPLEAKVSRILIKMCVVQLLALTISTCIKAMFTLVCRISQKQSVNPVDKIQQQKDSQFSASKLQIVQMNG